MLKRTGSWRDDKGRENALYQCECGEKDIGPYGLADFYCPRCDTGYTCGGAKLAPVQHWGEETGETAADLFGPQGDE